MHVCMYVYVCMHVCMYVCVCMSEYQVVLAGVCIHVYVTI